ncbi:MAG: TerB family tellurite resistance protein [Pelagibacterales bacterium]|nr:TerB family tellurite resistance protein [Pelagibacterales bacterium]
MLKFLKNKNSTEKTVNDDELLSKTASLLIHAAKIDEKYTDVEKKIIKKTLLELGANQSKIDQLILTAENNEQKSNQILDFTKKIKNTDDKFKIKIIESLWGVIYSDKDADMYETNLMRRLSGLLYLNNKVVGDIKEKMKKKFSK